MIVVIGCVTDVTGVTGVTGDSDDTAGFCALIVDSELKGASVTLEVILVSVTVGAIDGLFPSWLFVGTVGAITA